MSEVYDNIFTNKDILNKLDRINEIINKIKTTSTDSNKIFTSVEEIVKLLDSFYDFRPTIDIINEVGKDKDNIYIKKKLDFLIEQLKYPLESISDSKDKLVKNKFNVQSISKNINLDYVSNLIKQSAVKAEKINSYAHNEIDKQSSVIKGTSENIINLKNNIKKINSNIEEQLDSINNIKDIYVSDLLDVESVYYTTKCNEEDIMLSDINKENIEKLYEEIKKENLENEEEQRKIIDKLKTKTNLDSDIENKDLTYLKQLLKSLEKENKIEKVKEGISIINDYIRNYNTHDSLNMLYKKALEEIINIIFKKEDYKKKIRDELKSDRYSDENFDKTYFTREFVDLQNINFRELKYIDSKGIKKEIDYNDNIIRNDIDYYLDKLTNKNAYYNFLIRKQDDKIRNSIINKTIEIVKKLKDDINNKKQSDKIKDKIYDESLIKVREILDEVNLNIKDEDIKNYLSRKEYLEEEKFINLYNDNNRELLEKIELLNEYIKIKEKLEKNSDLKEYPKFMKENIKDITGNVYNPILKEINDSIKKYNEINKGINDKLEHADKFLDDNKLFSFNIYGGYNDKFNNYNDNLRVYRKELRELMDVTEKYKDIMYKVYSKSNKNLKIIIKKGFFYLFIYKIAEEFIDKKFKRYVNINDVNKCIYKLEQKKIDNKINFYFNTCIHIFLNILKNIRNRLNDSNCLDLKLSNGYIYILSAIKFSEI